mgnify:CR=1 FL=1
MPIRPRERSKEEILEDFDSPTVKTGGRLILEEKQPVDPALWKEEIERANTASDHTKSIPALQRKETE